MRRSAIATAHSTNEESNRNYAAKQHCYGKRYQVKIGESRFQVEVHVYYIRAFEPSVDTVPLVTHAARQRRALTHLPVNGSG